MMTMPMVVDDGEPPRRLLALHHPGAGDLLIIDGEDGGDDRAHHRRVRPVVHRPGPELRTVQAQLLQPTVHGARGSSRRISPFVRSAFLRFASRAERIASPRVLDDLDRQQRGQQDQD